jgi:stress response protein YsnF
VRTEQGAKVALAEERLRARTRPVQTGEVTIRKEVVTESRTLEVPVRREELIIERTPVERRPLDARQAGPPDPLVEQLVDRLRHMQSGEVLRIPIVEEEVVVHKRPVVVEEVTLGKRRVQDSQTVSDTVRREEARIEREGDVRLQDSGQSSTRTTSWEQAMPQYRTRWQQRSGTTGGRWEDVEPGYRYGWELRNRPEYRGRAWSEVESQVQRDWATRNPNTPWERARDSVREAWESTTG